MDASAQQLKRMVYAALMAALTAAGAYIAIPIGPVPIVLQNLFIMLAGSASGRPVGIDQRCGLSAGRRRGAAGICRRYRRSGKIRGAHRRIPAGFCRRRLSDRPHFGKRPGTCGHRCAGHGCRHPGYLHVRCCLAQGGHGNEFFQGLDRGHAALSHWRCTENCSRHTHRQGSPAHDGRHFHRRKNCRINRVHHSDLPPVSSLCRRHPGRSTTSP